MSIAAVVMCDYTAILQPHGRSRGTVLLLDKKAHIPCLDGLRAVSISLVIALHLVQRQLVLVPGQPWNMLMPFANGTLGVFIFFVISGYLITHLLLLEYRRTDAISLRDFYIKRVFRILPPLYVYVGFLGILGLFVPLHLHWKDAIETLLFIRNYSLVAGSAPASWALGHIWSLCVEEQFYLLWPPLLIWLLRRKGETVAAAVALAIIVASPLIRVGMFALHTPYSTPAFIGSMLHTRADALMFGCAAALLSGRPRFESVYELFARVVYLRYLAMAQVFLVSPVLYGRFQGTYQFTIGFTLDGLCVALLMLWCIRNPQSRLGRVLESRPLVYVGVLSYSVYIWQTLFLHPQNQTFVAATPLNLIAILAAAELSRRLVEKPALRLRNNFLRKPASISLTPVA